MGMFALGTAASLAQEGERKGPPPGGEGRPGGRLAEFLMRADSNKDGKISKEEFTSMNRGGEDAGERFARMDANSDGFVDKAEIESVGERMREGMRRGDGGGPEGGFRRPPEGDAPEGRRPEGGPGRGGDGPPGGGMPLDEIFGRMDKNGDGVVDKEEYTKFSLEEIEGRFARADGNNDGKLTKEEVKAGAERMRSMQRGPGGPGRGPGGPDGGFRRGPEGGRPGEGRPDSGGFRRPPSQGEGEGKARPEFEKPEGETKKDAA